MSVVNKTLHAPDTSFQNWDDIPWPDVKKKVVRLQMRIAKATPLWSDWVSPIGRCLLKGLSRMMGNYHVRFLGESGAATLRTYPAILRAKGVYANRKVL